MSRLLLTNDDGVDSPALVPFTQALQHRHDVAVVVPDGERSWLGKAISRHTPIDLQPVTRDGLAMHTTTGHPADATQLGVHGVAGGDVDVVVSGINLGFNHGAAFFLSSGTVGAAIEGWIAGLPAIAFSTGLSGGDWSQWRRAADDADAQPTWHRLAALCADVLDDVLTSGLADHADVVSINVPWDADDTTPRHVTTLGRVRYGALFAPTGDHTWEHQWVNLRSDGDLSGTDVEAATKHVITITPVRMPASPEIPTAMRAALTRR